MPHSRVVLKLNIKKLFMYGIGLMNLFIFLFSSDTFYNNSLFSLSARIILALSYVAFIGTFALRNRRRNSSAKILLLLLSVITSFFSFLLNPSNSLYDFIVLIGGYLSIPVYLILIPEIDFSKENLYWFRSISFVYASFFIYAGFFKPTYRIGTGALQLGYPNSNITGAYIMLVLILMIVASRGEKKTWYRILLAIYEAALIYLIVITQCRTAVFIGTLCTVYSYLPKFKRISSKFSIVCLVFPAVFLYGYIYFFSNNWLVNYAILGRTFYSGRQLLFQTELHKLSLFGDYANSMFAGLNSYLSIVNTLGLIGLTLYWFIFGTFLKSNYLDECDANFQTQMVRFCISILLLHGCTESALFTGGTVYAGMFACILMASACNIPKETEE